MSEYFLQGNEIISGKGKKVATLNSDGNVVMAPGMAGPHSRGVREFLNSVETRDEGDKVETLEIPEAEAAVEEVHIIKEEAQSAESVEEWLIDTIPDSALPHFSKALGCNTPGFAEYISKHKLTGPQVAALVKRLTK